MQSDISSRLYALLGVLVSCGDLFLVAFYTCLVFLLGYSRRSSSCFSFFFFNDTAPPEISTLPLPAALPISRPAGFTAAVAVGRCARAGGASRRASCRTSRLGCQTRKRSTRKPYSRHRPRRSGSKSA